MIPDPGIPIERRIATPLRDTASVPEGTLVMVPTAPATGGAGTAPVVAVNTTPWYKDAAFMSSVGGALLALEPVIEDALTAKTFNWRSFAASCLLALVAYFRNRSNTIVK